MRTLLLLALLAAPAAAQQPSARDELLRLVPNDTAICFVVQGLRERSKTVSASPLAEWVSAKYKPLVGAAPEVQKLKDVEALFTTFLGVSLTDLRDDIFGDAIVLAYQPGPVGRPEAEQGCVMVKARDPAKLAKLVAQLNNVQKSTKELTGVDERVHRGQAFYKRAKADGKDEFYLLKDGLFVFAAQEASIHAVIDQAQAANAEPSAVEKSIRQLGVQDSFLLCWFNPRKLDAEVKAHVATAGSAQDKAARQQFAQVWFALDNLAIYLDAGKDLELGVAAAYRADAMPTELRTMLKPNPTPSSLWQSIPEDALVAVAGRVTGSQLLDVLLAFSPPDERAAARQEVEKAIGAVVGKDKLPPMLKGVGPDWGLWVAPPKQAGWVPNVTVAARVNDSDASVPASVLKTLGFYAQLAQVHYNRDHDDQIESKDQPLGNVEMTVFTNPKLFPPGVQPAYGLTDGHLVLGGSPDLVRSFRKPAGEPKPTVEAPVLRVNGLRLHEYLGAHAKDIAGWVADRQDRPFDDVKKEIETVGEFLAVLDRAEVFVRGDGGVARFAVRLKFVKPLAK
jgi:hypothetical protein